MKINLVTETKRQRWILRPWAEALARNLPNTVVSCTVDPKAGVNIFVNYALYRPSPTLTMAVFTHREGSERGKIFDRIAEQVDWCFAQCKITKKLLPPSKTSILPTGPTDPAYYGRQIVLGVVGREYRSGRKRMDWIPSLKALSGVVVRQTLGKIEEVNMPAWYDGIDYLVVLANNEGGPQPVMEAIARGKPVIAPNVGYCWEYPVLRYTTQEELITLVRGLVIPQDTWKQAARIILTTARRLSGDRSRTV